MATLKFIVWGSAGYYDTGNELDAEVVGPFGFSQERDAKRKAKAMVQACEAHVEGQAEIVDSTEGLVWDGPFVWHVATLQIPDGGIRWDGGDPLAALRAECARRGIAGDDEQIQAFLDRCDLDVVGGTRDEFGSRTIHINDDVLESLLSALTDQ